MRVEASVIVKKSIVSVVFVMHIASSHITRRTPQNNDVYSIFLSICYFSVFLLDCPSLSHLKPDMAASIMSDMT